MYGNSWLQKFRKFSELNQWTLNHGIQVISKKLQNMQKRGINLEQEKGVREDVVAHELQHKFNSLHWQSFAQSSLYMN